MRAGETRHRMRVQTFLISGAWNEVVASDKEAGLSQPSDSDFMGRSRKHPSKDFATDRPALNPEQHAEEENGETTKNGDKNRNTFSLSGARGWIRFDATGPWLKENGGLIALAAAITIASLAAIAWRIWK